MVLGYNILDHFETKSQQRWTWSHSPDLVTVLTTGVIPPFVLVSDSAQVSATVQIFSAIDDSSVGAAQAIVLSSAPNSNQYFKYAGATGIGAVAGCYYYKIVTAGDTETYYSEVFEWASTYTNMLKVVASGLTAITLGGQYVMDLTSLTFTSYYKTERSTLDKDIKEKGAEKPYGDIPTFNTRNLVNKFTILGGKEIFAYLSGLRVLDVNGTIVFTYNSMVMTAYDIVVDKEDSISLDEAILTSIEFKETNYISARNTI